MIRFNVPPVAPKAMEYMQEAINNMHICGDGEFTKKCHSWIEQRTGTAKALLTTSCTHALEMAAHLCEIEAGDEVIMPSYTFVSTADAFVNRGARIVFVDVDPKTMNMDETKIEAAITPKTRAIVVMHYAGVSCRMDVIMDIARRHKLLVVEDAAQGVMSTYKGEALGAIADFGCYSFHETKNYSMGEGGALLIKDPKYIEKAEILREKGTDRSKYYRGQVDKYRWQDFGSSYLPSELNAAYLYAQLEIADEINEKRLKIWNRYNEAFSVLKDKGLVELPYVPEDCIHNAHMFYLKLKDMETVTAFIDFMKAKDILCVTHYVPLHSAPAGLKFGYFHGEDKYTTVDANRLVRMPLYYSMDEATQSYVIDSALEFFA